MAGAKTASDRSTVRVEEDHMGEELACGVLAGLASYADPAQLKFQGGSRLSPGAGLAPIRASHDSVVLAPGVPEGTDVISYATPKGEDGAELGQSPCSSADPPAPPALRVLVAKTLTNSDAGSGRIILPRVAVETHLAFVTPHRHYALRVRCARTGAQHAFVVKSWANGSEHRRVFVLEAAGEYLRTLGLGVGDTVGICAAPDGGLVVAANTPELRAATAYPRVAGGAAAAGPGNNARPGSALGLAGLPSSATRGAGACLGRCTRSGHCAKAAGHPGFCSGPKAAAAAAAAAAGNALRPAPGRLPSQASPSSSEGGPRAARDAFSPGASGGSSDEATTFEARTGWAWGARHDGVARPAPHAELALPGAPGDLAHPLACVARRALLSKTLTVYDLASGRVVLAPGDVAATVPEAPRAGRLTLAALDEEEVWRFFALRAWTSVAGRRGYVLEGSEAAAFLSDRGAAPGDELVLWRDGAWEPPRVEVLRARGAGMEDGETLRAAAPAPASAVTYADWPALLLPPAHGARGSGCGAGEPCTRTSGCVKHAGHQGFCSGHKGFRRRAGEAGGGPQGGRADRRARSGASQHAGRSGRRDEDEDSDYVPTTKRARATSGGGYVPRRSQDPLLSLLSLLD
ncbi:hypothetical protein ACKKBG_A25450 [Auxenochlorella protothecoides x Auxenochlorella symbiontica]